MEDNLKELITENLNKYDPETIEKSIKELKKKVNTGRDKRDSNFKIYS